MYSAKCSKIANREASAVAMPLINNNNNDFLSP